MRSRDPADGFGPERRSGALALTFDNLGEARELERGTLPAGRRADRGLAGAAARGRDRVVLPGR
jgi:hypothetical protein